MREPCCMFCWQVVEKQKEGYESDVEDIDDMEEEEEDEEGGKLSSDSDAWVHLL